MSDTDREALAAAIGADTDEWVIDAILANRDEVLRALGLREERAIDKPGMRGINPQRRFVTKWEDVTDDE